MQKVLVLGSGGFIGGALYNQLKNIGIHVWGYERKPRPDPNILVGDFTIENWGGAFFKIFV